MSKNKKKENFNLAMYEMFGIGKGSSPETTEESEKIVEDDAAFFEDLPDLTPAKQPDPIIRNAPDMPVPPVPPIAPAASKPVSEVSRSDSRTTFLAVGTSMEGTLRCDSDVEICGDFKGDLIANGRIVIHANTTSNVQANDLALVSCNLTGDATVSNCVTVDENSTIIGNVTAQELVCSGVVRGNITVSGNLTLNANAKVFGDIKTGSLVIERGARVSGKVEMTAL